jgi:hypothetical protein
MVVFGEAGLDGFVGRREEEILAVEPWQRPAGARANSRKRNGCWKQLFRAEAFVCGQAIERIVRPTPKRLKRSDENAGRIIDIRHGAVPSQTSMMSGTMPSCQSICCRVGLHGPMKYPS